MQWEALRLQLSMQRGLARRGRPERAMRTGDANVSNMVGAAGLEPARPKPEDFKSPAYANSATPPCAMASPKRAEPMVANFPEL